MSKFLFRIICTLIVINCIAIPYDCMSDTCTVQCQVTQDNVWGYYNSDHFQWTNPDTQVHLLVGFSGSLLIGELIHQYTHLPAWESALIGTLIIGLAGTTKEVMFDTYTSRTDIKAYWGGALIGGLTVTIIHF